MQEVEGSRSWTFSGLYDADVYLDNTQVGETEQLVAIYIGISEKNIESGIRSIASFLLLEETGQHEFRRVESCEVHNSQRNNNDDDDWYFGVNGGFLPWDAEDQIPLEELEAWVKWTREEFRIV